MGSLPDLIFIIDTVREQIAIKEAIKLNIPIAAIIDTNSDPEGITYPIPGNDDSTKSIKLYCDLISQAALDGISIQSQKIQDESQNKKEKPQKESASNVNNDSKELLDPETNKAIKKENPEKNNVVEPPIKKFLLVQFILLILLVNYKSPHTFFLNLFQLSQI